MQITFLDGEVPVSISSGSLEKANNTMAKVSVSSECDRISVADSDFNPIYTGGMGGGGGGEEGGKITFLITQERLMLRS